MKMIRKRTVKTTLEKILEISRDMVHEALADGYKLVTGNAIPNTTEGAVLTHIADAINKMNEDEQKGILKKFKEILRG